jgi:hypothetical protein
MSSSIASHLPRGNVPTLQADAKLSDSCSVLALRRSQLDPELSALVLEKPTSADFVAQRETAVAHDHCRSIRAPLSARSTIDGGMAIPVVAGSSPVLHPV